MILILSCLVMGIIGSILGKNKKIGSVGGFLLGFLFSLIGVLIVFVLPNEERKEALDIVDHEKALFIKHHQQELSDGHADIPLEVWEKDVHVFESTYATRRSSTKIPNQ